jgi:DnaJ-class molecular chaperone
MQVKECKRMTTNEASMVLVTQCPECGGDGRRSLGHPNDPYGRTMECEECGGGGEIPAACERCREEATEVRDGMFLCAAHGREARAEETA